MIEHERQVDNAGVVIGVEPDVMFVVQLGQLGQGQGVFQSNDREAPTSVVGKIARRGSDFRAFPASS